MVLLLLCVVLVAGCDKPANPQTAPLKSTAVNPGTNVKTAKTGMTGSTNEIMTRQAVFERQLGSKDPFFPKSSRLPKVSADGQSTNQAPRLPLSAYIKLTGIRPSKTRPIAMINQTFFEPGERGDVTVSIPSSSGATEVQKVRIRCQEIREDAVVISIEGEPGVIKLSKPAGP